jgi:S-adenosyl-L-methionine hydrolase (adenosine-forming)
VAASPIVFLSDFGLQDEFVGTCHGVIARTAPGARVIDLTHGVPRGDVLRGALLLQGGLPYVPDDAILLAVVDPGVGSARRGVAIRTVENRFLIGPDNGLLSPAWSALGGVAQAVEITSPFVVLQPTSATFHGRDVFAPAAGHLAAGEPVDQLGPPVDAETLVRVSLPVPVVGPGSLSARVLAVDVFGNVQLSAAPADLERAGLAGAAHLVVHGGAGQDLGSTRAETYAAVAEGALAVLVDSSGRLAVACNGGDAAGLLHVAPGDTIALSGTGV